MYIADLYNNRIRKVTVSTNSPRYVQSICFCFIINSFYSLSRSPTATPTYFPSLSPHSISVISTIAGTGTGSYSGDGSQATSATLNAPLGIAIDASGNVFFTDQSNHRVRKITSSSGIISTYAGTGTTTYSGDGGVASSATLYGPNGLCIDTSGSNIHTVTHSFNP